MTAIEYLQAKGIEYRLQSGQAVLKTCPFCGDQKSHFCMDQDEGAFYCHKCQERGNLITLQKHYGCQSALKIDPLSASNIDPPSA